LLDGEVAINAAGGDYSLNEGGKFKVRDSLENALQQRASQYVRASRARMASSDLVQHGDALTMVIFPATPTVTLSCTVGAYRR
jgi:hypothetical protein